MPMPSDYYSRFDPAKNYDEHLFIAGRGLQSAELNEIQKRAAYSLASVADVLFADGDIIRDAACRLDETTGDCVCDAGAIYLRGTVRGVPPGSFVVPMGIVAIGVYLIDTVITATEDATLRDPAANTRNYDEPGAERLQVEPQWGYAGDGTIGEFYPVYESIDRVLSAKEPPPNLDAMNQALARYDRDSTGGTYVVSGMGVHILNDQPTGEQVYSIAEGRARVNGYGIEFATARRVVHDAVPDLRLISNEPMLSANATAQRFDVDHGPINDIPEVAITKETTSTITHGIYTGAVDLLPNTSILTLIEVKQGGTTYVAGTDYVLTGSSVDWTPGGNEPAPGSTYTAKYQHIATVTPTGVDDTGFTVAGAVVGTLILATYNQKLPRWDRVCLDSKGHPLVIVGVSSGFNPVIPAVPSDILVLANIYQRWTTDRVLKDASVRMVSMPILAGIDGRLDRIMQLIAQQRLESNIHMREVGTKKGIFTDPFLDDSQRDAGIVQTAAIVDGVLCLPISANVSYVSADITSPQTCAGTVVAALDQGLKTGGHKINPHSAYTEPKGTLKCTPEVDRWTQVVSDHTSEITKRFMRSVGPQGGETAGGETVEEQDRLTSKTKERLRQIEVTFESSGHAPGEQLQKMKFDGVEITPTAI